MVITFEEEKQDYKKKIAVIVLTLVVIIGMGFLVYTFVINKAPVVSQTESQKIIVNWGALKDERLKMLEDYPEVTPFEGDTGKSNPFN